MLSARHRVVAAARSLPVSRRSFAAAAATPLTAEQIAIVKSTAPVLKQHGTAITTLFYGNMLRAHPELKNIFSLTSQANGRQPRALADAVLAYATHIDDLPALSHAVERIAHKHASLFVTADQYDIVGHHLLEAIGAVLGEAATPEIVGAWTAAYGQLAAVFIGREAALYAANENWQGWRKFYVRHKVPETAAITSFYLAPVDGAALPTFLPGQYVSLQLHVPSLGHYQSRQYSLSDAPRAGGDCYRISVKREEGDGRDTVPGLVSNLLHDSVAEGDVVELSHPQGEFFVDPADAASKTAAPLVLVSAGVGITPLMSILNTTVGSGRPVSWVHSARSPAAMAFVDHVRSVCQTHRSQVKASIFLEVGGSAGDCKGFASVYEGRLALGSLNKTTDLFSEDPTARYYICGPENFMIEARKGLVALGVSTDRIYLELFSTGVVPE